MEIREARKEDVKYINALCDRLMEYHLRFDEYYKLGLSANESYDKYFERLVTSKDSLVLIADDNGVIVGYIAGKMEERPPVFEIARSGTIDSVYILEEYRRRGIGREMTERMLKWFKNKGIKYVELSVDSKNELGYNVWKSLGFETWQYKMKKKI